MTRYLLTMGLLLALPWGLAGVVILGSAAAAVRRWVAARADRDESCPESLDLVTASPPGSPRAQLWPLPAADPREEETAPLVLCHGRCGHP